MNKYFIEIGHKSIQKYKQNVCGDVFMSRKLPDEGRTIAVLSDGLGSGIKANILATMTASMALNFTRANQPVEVCAESIRNTLPMDETRKINYSTFTITDIEFDGETTILEYGNSQFLLFRNGEGLKEDSIEQNIQTEITVSRFKAILEDRIILFSDGVSQSGMGRADMPFGWDPEDFHDYVSLVLRENPGISAQDLAEQIVNRSLTNDILTAKDDITCAVIYFRKPRNLLICTGPPYKKERDKTMASAVATFDGEKLICGGTTAQIIARELNREIEVDLFGGGEGIPPSAAMEGVDLVTEGILTVGKVAEWLEHKELSEIPLNNPAGKVIQLLLAHDKIHFLVGTRINEAHQDPALPMELEIRRNVIKKVARLLQEKYLKEIHIQFI